MNFKKNRNHKFVIRFVLSYIFILLVPLSIGLHGTQIASGIVKEDIRRSNLSMLNQTKNILDNQLQQVETLSLQVATNPRVSTLINLKGTLNDSVYLDMSAAIKDISRYMINRSDFISTFYIYLKNTNYVLTPETLYPTDIFYNMVLKNDNNYYTSWQEALFNNYYNGKYTSSVLSGISSSSSSDIIYIRSLPMSFNQKSEGVLTISIKKDNILNLFSSIDLSNGGWAYIQDSNGSIIASTTGNNKPIEGMFLDDLRNKEDFIQKRIANKDMIITYTTSNYNDWKYVIALPSDVVLKRLSDFKHISWTIFFVSLLIGVVIACLLTYQNSKPLLSIAKQLREYMGNDASKNEDAYSLIGGSITQLISNNKTLQQDLNNQKQLIYAAFLDKLFKGQVYNKFEFDATSTYIGLSISGSHFFVLLARIYNNNSSEMNLSSEIIEELNISKALVRGVLNKHFVNGEIIHEIDQRTIAVLISFDEQEVQNVIEATEKIMQDVSQDVLDTYNMKISIGAGDVYSEPLEIWHSLEQAELSLHYSSTMSNTVTWYHDIPKESETYYYPLDFEQRLINHAKVGDMDQIQKLLQIIYEENFQSRKLSLLMGRELIYEIKSTLVKLMSQFTDETTVKKQVSKIDPSKSVDQNFELIEDIYTKVCNLALNQKKNQSSELMRSIKKYIETNYMNQDIGLYKVASHFNLSEGYLSHLFKEQTGINFTDHLENVRMNHAKELLKNKDLNINDISEMIGYNSAQSFRRAFKRVCGVNPTALRDN